MLLVCHLGINAPVIHLPMSLLCIGDRIYIPGKKGQHDETVVNVIVIAVSRDTVTYHPLGSDYYRVPNEPISNN
jgi:hypothetical protein